MGVLDKTHAHIVYKLKALKAQFFKILRLNKTSGERRQSYEFYDQCQAIWGNSALAKPLNIISAVHREQESSDSSDDEEGTSMSTVQIDENNDIPVVIANAIVDMQMVERGLDAEGEQAAEEEEEQEEASAEASAEEEEEVAVPVAEPALPARRPPKKAKKKTKLQETLDAVTGSLVQVMGEQNRQFAEEERQREERHQMANDNLVRQHNENMQTMMASFQESQRQTLAMLAQFLQHPRPNYTLPPMLPNYNPHPQNPPQ
ncbi:uncharacterized protein [Antedon mediterranea]|uniref:uncharacterized protein n=1 Tax=Antedon mediterranea TaxID=105859 RepID=UPI003AF9C513